MCICNVRNNVLSKIIKNEMYNYVEVYTEEYIIVL